MIYSKMRFINYDRLFGCREVSEGMRKKIMESTYYYEHDEYTMGPDYDEEYIKTADFYTKDRELVASIKIVNGESSLEAFNKNVKVEYGDGKAIKKHLEELEKKRINDLEGSYKYLDSVDVSKEYIEKIKRDAFYVSVSDRYSPKGDLNGKSIQIQNERFEIICDYGASLLKYEKKSWDKSFRISGDLKESLKEGIIKYYEFFVPDWYLEEIEKYEPMEEIQKPLGMKMDGKSEEIKEEKRKKTKGKVSKREMKKMASKSCDGNEGKTIYEIMKKEEIRKEWKMAIKNMKDGKNKNKNGRRFGAL